MAFFSKSPAQLLRRRLFLQPHRTIADLTTFKPVRDRALDHIVEREKNLKPTLNLKNLILTTPSNSIPLATISDNRRSLEILTRPIDFIRSYPSVFQEFVPNASIVVPHVRLTPDAVELDSEEKLMYESESYKQEVADRLVKLLMLNRVDKLPLRLVDRMKWDLGLPNDYLESVVPLFPDYFRVVGSGNEMCLELVCWIDELAVSAVEKSAMKAEKDGLHFGEYMKGMPIEFKVEYSEGFEMDKKYKKWLDNWQKLDYMSPYQNAMHLSSASDESDKWVVGVLHELLSILVPKKSEKDNLLHFGQYLGLRPRMKRAMLQHPGIFYMSGKLGTHTIVLREAYKRNVLINEHVLMNMRSQYIHLMNMPKHIAKQQINEQKKKLLGGGIDGEDEQVQNGEDSDAFYSSSSDVENDSEEFEDDDDDEEEIQENKKRRMDSIKSSSVQGKTFNKHRQEKYTQLCSDRNKTHNHVENSRRFRNDRVTKTHGRSSMGFNSSHTRERQIPRRNDDSNVKLSWTSDFDKRGSFTNKTERKTDDKKRQSMRTSSPRSRGSPVYGVAEKHDNIRSNPSRVRSSHGSRRSN